MNTPQEVSQALSVLSDYAAKVALALEDGTPAPEQGWDLLHALHCAIYSLAHMLYNMLE